MTAAAAKAEFVRELGALLNQTLPPAARGRVNVAVIAKAADPPLDAGWPGAELARRVILGVATGDNPGALIVGNLRALAAAPPPPAAGPTPPQRRAVATSPQPLPECARCAQPFRRGGQWAECPACGAPLRLVEHDVQDTVGRQLEAVR